MSCSKTHLGLRETRMKFNEYQKEAMVTLSEESRRDMLLNAALGFAGEGGEICDHIKKHLFQGHELNREHIIKEVGDILWYAAQVAEGTGINLEEIAKRNIEKLRKRYPEGHFVRERSINRSSEDYLDPSIKVVNLG
jgi:NTP pyrophosphatase (non-canonical NTP hydrolase)